MKKLLTLTVLAVMLAFGANGAWADGPYPTDLTNGSFGPAGSVTPNSNTGEYEIYDAVNLLLGTSYTNNAQFDNLEYTGSANAFEQTGNAGYAVIGLGAGGTNTLEVYNTATPGTLVSPIGAGSTGDHATGNGTIGSPYLGSATSVFAPGTQFSFAIQNVSPSNVTSVFYANAALNSDGYDHVVAYNLSALTGTQVYIYNPVTNSEEQITLDDPYLLAFEDTSEANNGANDDMDYNDLMVLVNGVAPVPEPVTVALFGLGLIAMIGFSLRRKFSFVK